MIGLLFPGQGAQTPGFLHALPAHPTLAPTLEEASSVLGVDVLELDHAEALASTVAVQISLLVAGVAASRALAAEGVVPEAVAGLSVGAFAAAVAAGALTFSSALELIRLRATLMERAYPSGYGMAALVGLSEVQVAALLEGDAGAPRAYLANLNAPRQIVIAGSDAGLGRALAAARALGARKAERLAVSVPSHCVLLADAAAHLAEAAAQVVFTAPRLAYIANRNARVCRSAESVREDLSGNLKEPVRWHDSVRLMFELGVRVFVETPPGRTLTDLAADAFPAAYTLALAGLVPAEAAALIRRHATRLY